MKRIRRLSCLLLAFSLVFMLTIPAYASSIAVRPLDYIISLIANACGVEFAPLAGTSSMLGQMNDTMNDYVKSGGDITDTASYHKYVKARADNGQLGAFMQWRYSQDGVSARDKFFQTVDTVTSWIGSSWGDSVDITFGDENAVDVVKEWFSTFKAYRTGSLDYATKVNILPPYVPNKVPVGKVHLFTSYFYDYGGSTYYRDYYGPKDMALLGVYDYSTEGTDQDPPARYYYLYEISGVHLTRVKLEAYLTTIRPNGNTGTRRSDANFIDANSSGILSFPLFQTLDSAYAYVKDHVVNIPDIVYPNAVSLPVTGVNADVQKAMIETVPGVIALPENGTIQD